MLGMWGSITESEEHDGGFKESHGSDESRFPLIFLPNMDIVVSPANVKLGEQVDSFISSMSSGMRGSG